MRGGRNCNTPREVPGSGARRSVRVEEICEDPDSCSMVAEFVVEGLGFCIHILGAGQRPAQKLGTPSGDGVSRTRLDRNKKIKIKCLFCYFLAPGLEDI